MRLLHPRWAALASIAACTTGEGTAPRVVHHVVVSRASATMNPDDQLQFAATPRDADSAPISGLSITWASSDTSAVTISGTGLGVAVQAGVSLVSATAGGVTGSAQVTVNAAPPSPLISVWRGADSVAVATVVHLVASVWDGGGQLLPDATIDWVSRTPALASVTPSGLVTALQPGIARLVARAAGESTVVDLPIRPVAPRPAPTAVPLNDLAAGNYLGFQGGLYPSGLATPPPAHHAAGLARARGIVPRHPAGHPDPGGRYVLLSVGFSNATQEWCSRNGRAPCDAGSFMARAAADPAVDTVRLAIVNGARGGQVAHTWSPSTAANYDRVRDSVLAPRGLTEAQVQVIWFKITDSFPASPSLPGQGADALELVAEVGQALRAMRQRYPNLQLVLLGSRTYGGYATQLINPEPYAFEGGLAAKWVIEAQIRQMQGGGVDPRAGDLAFPGSVPWIAWGPYLWAAGSTPRLDGLSWERSDFEADATHPSPSGVSKVATRLLTFFKASAYTSCWFLAGGACP